VIAAVVAGAVFALGLAISGMTHQAKVAAFLDVTGAWDPALAFVMIGAIAVHYPFVKIAKQRARPILAEAFHWPTPTAIDAKLVVGSALFGIGWGLSGYCPGPALVSLGRAMPATIVFVLAMCAGIAITRFVTSRWGH
jgi:uncharacterized membrane protein YedE/YeeE